MMFNISASEISPAGSVSTGRDHILAENNNEAQLKAQFSIYATLQSVFLVYKHHAMYYILNSQSNLRFFS